MTGKKSGGTIIENVPIAVIVFPRGQLTEADRIRLNGVGFVAVEADDPERVITAVPLVKHVSGSDITDSMIAALAANSSAASEFGRMLVLKMKPKQSPKAEEPHNE